MPCSLSLHTWCIKVKSRAKAKKGGKGGDLKGRAGHQRESIKGRHWDKKEVKSDLVPLGCSSPMALYLM